MIKYVNFILLFILTLSVVNNVYATFPEPYNADKDITLTDKTFVLTDNSVTVSYTRPAQPMKPFDISFSFEKDNVKSLIYTTNMIMNMGRYNFIPKQAENSSTFFSVTPTLPKCGSGRTLWYGLLEITYNSGKKDKVIFFYNVK